MCVVFYLRVTGLFEADVPRILKSRTHTRCRGWFSLSWCASGSVGAAPSGPAPRRGSARKKMQSRSGGAYSQTVYVCMIDTTVVG